jgi:hypothetical protein
MFVRFKFGVATTSEASPMPTSYSRRTGNYLYDIEVQEAAPPPPAEYGPILRPRCEHGAGEVADVCQR